MAVRDVRKLGMRLTSIAWRPLLAGAVVLACLALLILIFTFLPVTYQDWLNYLRPASLEWRSPYRGGVFNPPWLFLMLHPLALMPPRLGAGVLMTLSLVVVAVYAKSPWKTLMIGSSAPMVALFTLGQVDALLLLGLASPGGLGVPLLMMKPQAVFLTLLPRINRRSVAVTALVVLLSMFVWGPWWSHLLAGRAVVGSAHNVSLFPWSAVAGFALLWGGIRRDSDALLCLASLCFCPYYQITSVLPAVAAAVREARDPRWSIAAWLGSWAYLLLAKGS